MKGVKLILIGMMIAVMLSLSACESIECITPNIVINGQCCVDFDKDGFCDTMTETQEAENSLADADNQQQILEAKGFDIRIYYGDEKGNQLNEVFAGEQEQGTYYLWLKNQGDYNATCTIYQNQFNTYTNSATTKQRFTLSLQSKEDASRVYSFTGFHPSIDELPDTVVCSAGGAIRKITATPQIGLYSWKRYASGDDPENPIDLAKKINIGGNMSFIDNGEQHTFYVVENTQNTGCTIKARNGKTDLLVKKTQRIDGEKVTLMESGFGYCTILFW
jgi:hypothetical protein